jgi:RHS repeat-associated protein
MYRKAANNGTAGQANPLPMTAIESSDISKSTNRFSTNTTYNDAGMVIVDNKFRSMNFSYDANGRQVNATNTGTSTTATTVYDALGNRVATKVNDSWQFVIYDAFGKLVAEYGTQGEGNGGVSYVLQDWQGSVRASVNNNGFIQARFDFTAFGEEVSLGVGTRSIEQGYSGDATTRQGYGLTEKDSSGLNHTWFRKNENRAGRWTSPDPYKGSMKLGNPQSFNRYSYVENDAVNLVDPQGLQLRSYDVYMGMGCVTMNDGRVHCTQYINRYWYDDEPGGGSGGSNIGGDYGGLGGSGGGGLPAEDDKRGPCERMADRAQEIADKLRLKGRISASEILKAFNNEFTSRYIGQSVDGWRAAATLAANGGGTGSADPQELGQSDFLARFWEGTNAGLDQVHHFAAYFSAGITGGASGYGSTSVHWANDDNEGDRELGSAAYALGSALRGGEQNIPSTFEKLENIGRDIKNSICNLKK